MKDQPQHFSVSGVDYGNMAHVYASDERIRNHYRNVNSFQATVRGSSLKNESRKTEAFRRGNCVFYDVNALTSIVLKVIRNRDPSPLENKTPKRPDLDTDKPGERKMGTAIHMSGVREIPSNTPKTEKSRMETMIITPSGISAWKTPPFQRPTKVTRKVHELEVDIKANGGCIPGVISLGVFKGDTYVMDGLHRLEAFRLSELPEGIVDIRIRYFDSMAEMGKEFVELNSSLRRMTNDDIIRGLEGTHPGIREFKKLCPFVGYEYLRANTNTAPVMLVSTSMRSWFCSASEVPNSGNSATAVLIEEMTVDEARRAAQFYNLCFACWGREADNRRLWGACNIVICAWLWRRTVTDHQSPKATHLDEEDFSKGLMALSSNSFYVNWLSGRIVGDRDRAPCYSRIKEIFSKRLVEDGMKKPSFPGPEWAHGKKQN